MTSIMADDKETKFLTSARASRGELESDSKILSDADLLESVFNALPELLLVLNEQRQAVLANSAVLRLLGIADLNLVLGKRPGELFQCEHACQASASGGCGTTEYCRNCGAVLAIVAAMNGNRETRECRITMRVNGGIQAVDFRVTAYPLVVSGRKFVAVYLLDISSEKRRQVLERLFMHDIANSAGAVETVMGMLTDPTTAAESTKELTALGSRAAHQLVEEVNSQRMLIAAEQDQLAVNPVSMMTREVFESVIAQLSHTSSGRFKNIILSGDSVNESIFTDHAIVRRVLFNMLKNALEASAQGETVQASITREGACFVFSVINSAVIKPEFQTQIFKRSFSTKGEGRGLGTYSMRLFTENYLRGKISFSSEQGKGTAFRIVLPEKYGQ